MSNLFNVFLLVACAMASAGFAACMGGKSTAFEILDLISAHLFAATPETVLQVCA